MITFSVCFLKNSKYYLYITDVLKLSNNKTVKDVVKDYGQTYTH